MCKNAINKVKPYRPADSSNLVATPGLPLASALAVPLTTTRLPCARGVSSGESSGESSVVREEYLEGAVEGCGERRHSPRLRVSGRGLEEFR